MKNILKIITAAVVAFTLNSGLNAADNGSPFDASGISLSSQGGQVPAVSGHSPDAKGASEAAVPAHGYTPEQNSAMEAHNTGLKRSFDKGLALDGDARVERKYRPYADYEAPGYLIMSSDFNFESRQAKLEMASRLPADGTLVIFSTYIDAAAKESILGAYEAVVPRARIKIIALNGSGRGFWARDGIPVPVLDSGNKLVVVDAVYGHGFEPDAEIARLFGAGIERHEYYFEGGNFQANAAGDCMMVNHGAHVRIPDAIFTEKYGCRQLIRLPFVDGIGHVDEHARFISEKVIVTDIPQYKDLLQAKGFTVHMLPKPAGAYETYVNSLIMNDRVIVPVFGRASDAEALAVYQRLGLKASGANSNALSNQGQGSVHCITMTYPKVPAAELMKALGGREI